MTTPATPMCVDENITESVNTDRPSTSRYFFSDEVTVEDDDGDDEYDGEFEETEEDRHFIDDGEDESDVDDGNDDGDADADDDDDGTSHRILDNLRAAASSNDNNNTSTNTFSLPEND